MCRYIIQNNSTRRDTKIARTVHDQLSTSGTIGDLKHHIDITASTCINS